MQKFVKTWLDPGKELHVVDIGSQKVGGYMPPYRDLFTSPKWKYTGCDMAAGENVDIVLKNPYRWKELKSRCADVVISGQAFEHIEFFWITIMEMMRILKPGGFICIIAPSAGFPHRYPVDCWRFYEEGMKALARFATLDVLETYTQRNRYDFEKYDRIWQDTVLVAKKPAQGFAWIRDFFRCRACYYLMKNIPELRLPDLATVVAQVFFDHGKGYFAGNSMTTVINAKGKEYIAAFDMNLYSSKNIYGIRFDPADFPAKFDLKEAAAVYKDGSRRPLRFALGNQSRKEGESFVFEHNDANLYFYPDGPVEEMDALLFLGALSAI